MQIFNNAKNKIDRFRNNKELIKKFENNPNRIAIIILKGKYAKQIGIKNGLVFDVYDPNDTIFVGDIIVDATNTLYKIKDIEYFDFSLDDIDDKIRCKRLNVEKYINQESILFKMCIQNNMNTNATINIIGDNINNVVIKDVANNSYFQQNNASEVWKSIKSELEYRFDREKYITLIKEIDNCFLLKKPINEKKISQFFSGIGQQMKDILTSFMAKFAAEMLKKE